MDVNKVTLAGAVGDQPELKVTNGGHSLLKIRMLTSRVDEQGTERKQWHSVVVWGREAERLKSTIHKGTRIRVEGELRGRSYEVNGDKRYITEVSANSVTVEKAVERAEKTVTVRDDDDEIPF